MSSISHPEQPNAETADHKPTVFLDAEVVDPDGVHIGKVADVLYDEALATPQWLAVDLGLLASQHYVPVHNAYKSGDGRVVVPYDRAAVKHAPRAHKDHILTRELAEELHRHYS